MGNSEAELKMSVDAQTMARMRRHPLIKAHRQGRAVTKSQYSVYFDTEDLTLARQGIVLRVRKVGDKRLQTVKTEGHRTAGLFQRGEWEAEIQGDRPNLAPLLDGEWGEIFGVEGLAERLRPLFATDVRRTIHILANPGWEVELCFDEGEILLLDEAGQTGAGQTGAGQTGGERLPISEIEIELKKGAPAHLYSLGRVLQDELPARLMSSSKSDRAFALIRDLRARSEKAKPVRLTAEMSVADAFQAIGRSCLHHMLANQDCLIESRDPEGVHQMRVALRRFRSALNVFKPLVGTPQALRIRGEIKWLLDHLGPARDIDVFIKEMLDPVAERFPDHGLGSLRDYFQQRRDAHYQTALAALASPRFTSLALEWGAWIEAGDWLGPLEEMPPEAASLLAMPILHYAERDLERRHRRVRRAGEDLRLLAPEIRHGVRILVKRLRYGAEFFSCLYPERRVTRFTAAMADVQDTLGGLNDIAVAHQLLAETVASASPAPKAKAGAKGKGGTEPKSAPEDWHDRIWAAGLIAGFNEARSDSLLAQACEAWDRFGETPRFWRR